MTSNDISSIVSFLSVAMKNRGHDIPLDEGNCIEDSETCRIDLGFVNIYIDSTEIVITYDTEREEYLRDPYLTDEAWIDDVAYYINALLSGTVVRLSDYDKATGKLIGYKIIVENEYRKKRILKKVFCNLIPFASLKAKDQRRVILSFQKEH